MRSGDGTGRSPASLPAGRAHPEIALLDQPDLVVTAASTWPSNARALGHARAAVTYRTLVL